MAVGTVSGTNLEDTWQLVGSTALTGLTSYTFSNISGYKKFRLAFRGKTTTAGSNNYVRFNGNTTNGDYFSYQEWIPLGATSSNYEFNQISIGIGSYSNVVIAGYLNISDANQSVPHIIDGGTFDGVQIQGMFFDTNPITSITFGSTASTYNGGTLYLYGIAA
jgi:hypothetical protein